MRVAEDVLVQQRRMLEHLGLCVQAGARVIEVDVMLVVEAAVLADPQRIDGVRGGVLGKGGEKFLVRLDPG